MTGETLTSKHLNGSHPPTPVRDTTVCPVCGGPKLYYKSKESTCLKCGLYWGKQG